MKEEEETYMSYIKAVVPKGTSDISHQEYQDALDQILDQKEEKTVVERDKFLEQYSKTILHQTCVTEPKIIAALRKRLDVVLTRLSKLPSDTYECSITFATKALRYIIINNVDINTDFLLLRGADLQTNSELLFNLAIYYKNCKNLDLIIRQNRLDKIRQFHWFRTIEVLAESEEGISVCKIILKYCQLDDIYNMFSQITSMTMFNWRGKNSLKVSTQEKTITVIDSFRPEVLDCNYKNLNDIIFKRACKGNDTGLVNYIIQRSRKYLDLNQGLMESSQQNVIECLVEQGADITQDNSKVLVEILQKEYIYLFRGKQLEMAVMTAVRLGADPSVRLREIINILLKQQPISYQLLDFFAAYFKHDEETRSLQTLLSKKILLNQVITQNYPNLLMLLLSSGAKISEDHVSMLIRADHATIARIICNQQSFAETIQKVVLKDISLIRSLEMMKILEEFNFIDKDDDKRQQERLMEAIKRGNPDMVLHIITGHSDKKRLFNDNILLKAVELSTSSKRQEILRILIEQGANVRGNDDEALFKAVYYNLPSTVKILLDNNANKFARNNEIFNKVAMLSKRSPIYKMFHK